MIDRPLRFLNEHHELGFLLATVPEVWLSEASELSEEVIKKIKRIKRLKFEGSYKLSNQSNQSNQSEFTLELLSRTCKSLRSLFLFHRTVTERLLKIMSNHLENLDEMEICNCKCETLKPLAEFRNLDRLLLNFAPPGDELTFICENSRTLDSRVWSTSLHDMIRHLYENCLPEKTG